MSYATLDAWIQSEALPFDLDSSEAFNTAIDSLITALGDSVELLGFGETLHGGEDILVFRNRLFQRLVEKHGYSAIAVESSFPRGRLINDYVMGHGPASFDAVRETGFSHDFGRLDANRELIEWMREYNAESSHPIKLQFYGFDSPTEMMHTDSPRHVLHFVLDYLTLMDGDSVQAQRERLDSLLGSDSDWENPAAMMDPTQSVGLSDAATELRIETEDLITELKIRQPELVSRTSKNQHEEALHYAEMARQLLNYHATLARQSDDRVAIGLGIRDSIMADNLEYIVSRERGRGKVLAFAHNSHLKRGLMEWQLGPHLLQWWPAGSQLQTSLGTNYVVIGTAVGVSEDNGIRMPEPGTLEAWLTASAEPALLIPTYQGQGLPEAEITGLPIRSGSQINSTYFPLTRDSFTAYDWLCVLRSTKYTRGGPPLRQPDSGSG